MTLGIQPPVAGNRLSVLDGWRGISILSVLACHLLPLGAGRWQLNEMAGPLGMGIFFTLSGFLITSTLLERPDARSFFIRRACRILPLAYLFAAFALLAQHRDMGDYVGYLLFYTNYDGKLLTPMTSPMWSLCVEVQFYVFVGLLAAAGGRKALYVLPLVGLAVTALRIHEQVYISINTHLRVDEILAGSTVALIHHEAWGLRYRRAISRVPLPVLIVAVLASCHPASGPLQYARPYLGAAMVAHTLWCPTRLAPILEGRVLKYFADVSYALYVIHPINRWGWLATGGTAERYLLKRPVGILLTLILAHLSTFYFEKQWISLGRRLSGAKRKAAHTAEPALAAIESGTR